LEADPFAMTGLDPSTLRARLAELEPDLKDGAIHTEVVRSPGRVNLIGEYTDVNGGFVLPAAIDLEIRLAFVRTVEDRVVLHRADTGESAQFDLNALPSRGQGWLDYAVGTAWALSDAGLRVHGFRGLIGTSLPVGAGLSSSAAVELAIARALLGTEEPLDPMQLARICQRAENQFVGVQSGLMDQFAVACGRRGNALLLDCRSLEWRTVRLPLAELSLVVCDTGSPRQLAKSEYNVRRRQCEEAVEALQAKDPGIRSLRDVTPAMLAAAEAVGLLDPVVARRARHVVLENDRVLATAGALEAGDLAAVADAFAKSHASLRDDFEVSSPALDAMVEIALSTPGVIAARMTGAGFGGCTVNLVRPDAVHRLADAVARDYPARTGLTPRVFPVTPADGASFIESTA
jgi:galactokinase